MTGVSIVPHDAPKYASRLNARAPEAFRRIKYALLTAYARLPNQPDRHNFDRVVWIRPVSVEPFMLCLEGYVQRLHCRFGEVFIHHWDAYL